MDATDDFIDLDDLVDLPLPGLPSRGDLGATTLGGGGAGAGRMFMGHRVGQEVVQVRSALK